MKKKNGAHFQSAMSELLSRQNRNEINENIDDKAVVHHRRGYIETLDAPEVKKPVSITPKVTSVPSSSRRVYIGGETHAHGEHDLPKTEVAHAIAKRPSHPIGKKTVGSTAKIVRIAVISAVIICLCTCIISAVLLSDNESVELHSDAVIGELLSVEDEPVFLAESAYSIEGADVAQMYRVDFTFYKKDTVSCLTPQRTVGELIDLLGLELDENELARVDLNGIISEDTEVNVDCVEYGTDTATVSVDYETRYVDIQTIPRGTTQVYQQGKAGTKTIEYKVTYLNGVENEREQTNEYISVSPTECIVYRGVGGTVTVGGKSYNYSYYIDCRSTVYTGGGTCATGVPASENVIAVDPRVIPLGTRVYVDGVGLRTAADTGGAIKGNFIDIYYEPSNTRFIGYGIRNVRVYIF